MSAQKPAIVVATRFMNAAPWAERFRRLAPEREVIVLARPDAPLPDDYYLTCWKPDPAVFHRSPRPKAIFSFGAGVDHIMLAGPPEGVPVGRVVDPDLAGRMAEYVTLHALWHFRQMSGLAAAQREGRWSPPDQPAARDVTIGLMGVGEMGQAAAGPLRALGFRVVGWGRTPRAGLPFETMHGAAGLEAFLAQTDILVSLLPSTPDTRGLIGGALLAKLNRPGPIDGPCFINAGRGDAVVEDELVAALRDGVIRAASLDVFSIEPLPVTSPLWTMSNVLVTPHAAADSSPETIAGLMLAEMARLEQGLALKHGVDPARGY